MSTIMNALRKVEDQKAAATQATDPGLLDKKIVKENAPAASRPARSLALVAAAVVVSGIAGVGVTLAALSYFRSGDTAVVAPETTVAVSSPAARQAVSAGPSDDGETTVVVAADVLNQTTEPPSVSAPVSTRVIGDPDTIAKLKARREARLSRMPGAPTSAPAQAKLPVAEPAKSSAEANPEADESVRVTRAPSPFVKARRTRGEAIVPAPRPEVAEVPVVQDTRPDNPIAARQLEETQVIEAELAKLRTPTVEQAERAWADPEDPAIFERAVDEAVDVVVVENVLNKMNDEVPDAAIERVVESEAKFEAALASDPSEVPRFAISGTTWHPHRQRRTATVEVEDTAGGTRVVEIREGEMLGPMKVKEIGPTGVKFFHDGKEVRRRIGIGRR